jgi:serine beta-lactamase-like protein LACTB, mitochondrial
VADRLHGERHSLSRAHLRYLALLLPPELFGIGALVRNQDLFREVLRGRRLRRLWPWGLVAGALVGCGSEVRDATDSDLIAEARARAAVAYVDSLRAAHGLPAVSAAVAVDGRVVWEYATGWSDSVNLRRATVSSAFRIGSVSKLLTAVATVRLWERGELDLDRPVQDLVADVPASRPPITPRLLAGHLGGIRHYGRADYVSRVSYPEVSATLHVFLGDSLVATPGTRYAYSSYGYNLLGAVLERAAGKDFRVIIRDEVTGPLGLEGIVASDSIPTPNEVGYFSRDAEGVLSEAPYVNLSDRWPSGGYIGTASDLARFGSSVFGYLSDAGRTLMLTPLETADGNSTGVGMGWRIGSDGQERRTAHHGGDALGSRAFLLVFPEERVAVTAAANLNFAPISETEALRIAELILR